MTLQASWEVFGIETLMSGVGEWAAPAMCIFLVESTVKHNHLITERHPDIE